MSVQKYRVLAMLAGALILGACKSEPTCDYSKAPYMAAASVPSLKAPEGLSTPDRSNVLIVPPTPANAPPPPSGKGKCLDRPPSYFSTTPRTEPVPEKK
jgi:hypothetical protein